MSLKKKIINFESLSKGIYLNSLFLGLNSNQENNIDNSIDSNL